MGLLLICPHCQAEVSPASRTCPACGASLRNLPPEHRRYSLGRPEEIAAVSPFPEIAPEPIPEVVEVVESYPETLMPEASLPEGKDVSLCEALDRILNKGAVLFGEVMISVADIDLVYLGLQVILASMETARGFKPLGDGQLGPNLFDKGAY
jgi:hypothetical protein